MREILRDVRSKRCYELSAMGEGFTVSSKGMLLTLAN